MITRWLVCSVPFNYTAVDCPWSCPFFRCCYAQVPDRSQTDRSEIRSVMSTSIHLCLVKHRKWFIVPTIITTFADPRHHAQKQSRSFGASTSNRLLWTFIIVYWITKKLWWRMHLFMCGISSSSTGRMRNSSFAILLSTSRRIESITFYASSSEISPWFFLFVIPLIISENAQLGCKSCYNPVPSTHKDSP